MSKSYKYNDEFQQDDYIDEAESYGYEVKNIRRQRKKSVRKFKDYSDYDQQDQWVWQFR